MAQPTTTIPTTRTRLRTNLGTNKVPIHGPKAGLASHGDQSLTAADAVDIIMVTTAHHHLQLHQHMRARVQPDQQRRTRKNPRPAHPSLASQDMNVADHTLTADVAAAAAVVAGAAEVADTSTRTLEVDQWAASAA